MPLVVPHRHYAGRLNNQPFSDDEDIRSELKREAFTQQRDILGVDDSSDEEEFNKIMQLDELIEQLLEETVPTDEEDDSFRATIGGGFSDVFEKSKWNKILQFLALVQDLRPILDDNSKDIDKIINEVVAPSLVEFENEDHFVEAVELAACTVSVMNEKFWSCVINSLLMNFQSMQLSNLAIVLNQMQNLGFQGPLAINPEFLPDRLLVKTNRLVKKFQHRVLISYLRDQIDLYGEDIAYSPTKESLTAFREKLSFLRLLSLGRIQTIYDRAPENNIICGEDLMEPEGLYEFVADFQSLFQLEGNMELFHKLAQHFNFNECIDLLEVYPSLDAPNTDEDVMAERAENLKELFSIIMAMVGEGDQERR